MLFKPELEDDAKTAAGHAALAGRYAWLEPASEADSAAWPRSAAK